MIYQYKRVALLSASLLFLLVCSKVNAFDARETAAYFNGPAIGTVTDTTAEISLSRAVVSRLTDEEKAGLYFEYSETNQVCIAIYPAPESCLPKKTDVGKTSIVLANLKPNTSYTVTYKRDNTIRCITTPCPSNDFKSLEAVFVTKSSAEAGTVPLITRNLTLKSSGKEVLDLQKYLIKEGYLSTAATGYYGKLTSTAVKEFQKAHSLPQVGIVGPVTRAYLSKLSKGETTNNDGETFEGKVTAYSTACFADGICSITIDDKKVVTTIGWSQKTVGEVRGIPDFGSIEKYVGAQAKVYAKKTEDGYTLYGDKRYYIEILPKSMGKLPSGSVPSGDLSLLPGVTWSLQKMVSSQGVVTTPSHAERFTLTLTKDGNLSGTTDCNNFFGTYTLASEGLITFGALGSTKMYCEGSQESVFTNALAKAGRVIMGDRNTLQIVQADGASMYFLKK